MKPKLRQETRSCRTSPLVAKALLNVGAELMDVEVGSIDERVGYIADGIEQLALFHDGARDGFHFAQGVGPTGFGVAPDEDPHPATREKRRAWAREALRL